MFSPQIYLGVKAFLLNQNLFGGRLLYSPQSCAGGLYYHVLRGGIKNLIASAPKILNQNSKLNTQNSKLSLPPFNFFSCALFSCAPVPLCSYALVLFSLITFHFLFSLITFLSPGNRQLPK